MEKGHADLLILTWTAGFLDALTYLHAHVFTANMTGNTVLLGIDLLGNHGGRFAPAAISVCAFATGALIAAVILKRNAPSGNFQADMRVGIGLELPLLFAYALLAGRSRSASIITGAVGLGIQSVAVRRLRISGVVTTFITGTITAAAGAAVSRDEHESSPWLLTLILLCYVTAAVCASALDRGHSHIAAFVPFCSAAIVELRCLRPIT